MRNSCELQRGYGCDGLQLIADQDLEGTETYADYLHNACQTIGLGDGQAEAVLLERAGRGVPEFAEGLRGVTELHPLPDEHAEGRPITGC
jgi:hypothetical protein